jgi:hypothetical protein
MEGQSDRDMSDRPPRRVDPEWAEMIASANRERIRETESVTPRAVPPSERRWRRFWRLAAALALVAPIVLAITLPWSESDGAVGGVTMLGVVGGILWALSAATLYARNQVGGMSGAQAALWVVLGIIVALFLGFLTFSIWFARGPDTLYPG